MIVPRIIPPNTIAHEDNCPIEKLPPGKLPPPYHKIFPENNCPHSSKFPQKSPTGELRVTMHELRVL